MNFAERMGTARKDSIFAIDGYFVWCGTMTKGDDGLYYLYFSFWKESLGFDAWVTDSKVGYAVGADPFGKFEYQGIALEGANTEGAWDRDCIHNPSVIKHNGKYYMYYMGNYGNGEFWDNRNHQRVGVAVAENPRGPWQRFDKPVIDISPSGHDSLMTSNPAVTPAPDGKFYMIYKAVENNGKLPKGGAVVCGIAVADSPTGPFVKSKKPIMVNPENEWSVEDAFIWYENDRFYSLAKDFQGYFTNAGKKQVALFESKNGYDWNLSDTPLAFWRELVMEDGTRVALSNMERPQIYVEDGVPKALVCACMKEEDYETLAHSFNVRIPIKS